MLVRTGGSLLLAASLVLPPLFVGCGSYSTVELTAKPSAPHKADGRVIGLGGPLTGARIEFVPADGVDGRLAIGELKADGTYELSTEQPGDGIVEGRYKVRIVPPPGIAKFRAVPPRYFDEDGSGLVVQVTPETSRIPAIKLSSNSASPRVGEAKIRD